LCLLFNKLVNCSSLWFIFVLIMGIILVHFQNGWFVVGHGQNGVEYSVLLICCFIVLITNPSTTKLKETVNTDQ
jgi:putative oxidoreductase